MDITKEQFQVYEEIRHSGITNMWDTRKVSDTSDGSLDRAEVLEIIHNYEALYEKYIGQLPTHDVTW